MCYEDRGVHPFHEILEARRAGLHKRGEPAQALSHDDFNWARPQPAKVRAAAKKSQAKPVREAVASPESLPEEAEPSLPALSQALPSDVEAASEAAPSVPMPKAKGKAKAKAKGQAILKRPGAGIVKRQLAPVPQGHYILHGHKGVHVILPLGKALGCPKCSHAAIGCKRCRIAAGLELRGSRWQRPEG